MQASEIKRAAALLFSPCRRGNLMAKITPIKPKRVNYPLPNEVKNL